MTHHADVEIKAGQLYSKRFDDIYFSGEDGIAESQYVFLEGNNLPERWQHKANFCIAETGFGSGLNFLVTVQAWLNDPNRSKRLDYFSIEAFPLKLEHLSHIQAHWKDYQGLSVTLIEQYPVVTRGCHTLLFEQGRIQLHLILEDIQAAFKYYSITPDCWFLDGFAPAKNPQMWSLDVLNKIGKLSTEGTQLATFTAAGAVRRGLVEAGFEVNKRKGYSRKREMICARKSHATTEHKLFKHAPWFASVQTPSKVKRIAVIGAGIAGVQIAYHLAQQGMEVQVLESKKNIATGASGNQAGVLAPRITAQASEGEAFYIAAFLYQLNQLNKLKQQGQDVQFVQSGLLQLAHNDAALRRFAKLAKRRDLPETLVKILSAAQASNALNEQIEHPAMFISSAGSLSPKSLCQTLLAHHNIDTLCETEVERISHTKGKPRLHLRSGETLCADAVVIANGYQAANFADCLHIIAARGQTSAATLATNQALPHALGHKGYVVGYPADEHQIIFGASYIRGEYDSALDDAETESNLSVLRRHAPKLAETLSNISDSHAGIRATTLDRWPIVGPLPDIAFYETQYSDLAQGKQYKAYPNAQYLGDIYVLSGLGSRGLTSAAYCANLLSHMILGAKPPAPKQTLHSMHPARFLLRALRRKQGNH